MCGCNNTHARACKYARSCYMRARSACLRMCICTTRLQFVQASACARVNASPLVRTVSRTLSALQDATQFWCLASAAAHCALSCARAHSKQYCMQRLRACLGVQRSHMITQCKFMSGPEYSARRLRPAFHATIRRRANASTPTPSRTLQRSWIRCNEYFMHPLSTTQRCRRSSGTPCTQTYRRRPPRASR